MRAVYSLSSYAVIMVIRMGCRGATPALRPNQDGDRYKTDKPHWVTGVYWRNIIPNLPVELSCKSEYALLALLELATHFSSGEPLQIRQIAAEQNIPDRYLEQLLATLRRGGLVRSQRGAKGGYVLAREPWKITLLDVVNCIEGSDTQPSEPPGEPKSVAGIVICDIWQEAGQAADAVLRKNTLQDVVEQRDSRRSLDIMYYI